MGFSHKITTIIWLVFSILIYGLCAAEDDNDKIDLDQLNILARNAAPDLSAEQNRIIQDFIENFMEKQKNEEKNDGEHKNSSDGIASRIEEAETPEPQKARSISITGNDDDNSPSESLNELNAERSKPKYPKEGATAYFENLSKIPQEPEPKPQFDPNIFTTNPSLSFHVRPCTKELKIIKKMESIQELLKLLWDKQANDSLTNREEEKIVYILRKLKKNLVRLRQLNQRNFDGLKGLQKCQLEKYIKKFEINISIFLRNANRRQKLAGRGYMVDYDDNVQLGLDSDDYEEYYGEDDEMSIFDEKKINKDPPSLSDLLSRKNEEPLSLKSGTGIDSNYQGDEPTQKHDEGKDEEHLYSSYSYGGTYDNSPLVDNLHNSITQWDQMASNFFTNMFQDYQDSDYDPTEYGNSYARSFSDSDSGTEDSDTDSEHTLSNYIAEKTGQLLSEPNCPSAWNSFLPITFIPSAEKTSADGDTICTDPFIEQLKTKPQVRLIIASQTASWNLKKAKSIIKDNDIFKSWQLRACLKELKNQIFLHIDNSIRNDTKVESARKLFNEFQSYYRLENLAGLTFHWPNQGTKLSFLKEVVKLLKVVRFYFEPNPVKMVLTADKVFIVGFPDSFRNDAYVDPN